MPTIDGETQVPTTEQETMHDANVAFGKYLRSTYPERYPKRGYLVPAKLQYSCSDAVFDVVHTGGMTWHYLPRADALERAKIVFVDVVADGDWGIDEIAEMSGVPVGTLSDGYEDGLETVEIIDRELGSAAVNEYLGKAVERVGIAAMLADYDGREVELPCGMVAYRVD